MAQPKGVLVIEDEEAIVEVLKTMLEIEGYSVSTAENGQKGIELLREIPKPGLILLDLMMPVMNGWEFAQAIEKEPAYSDIPIVVFTAFSDKIANVRNARRVLGKPLDFEELFKTVREFCSV
jgi:CheY-like chemotaxis protein